METTLVAPRRASRQPVSPLGKLSIATMVAMAGLLAYLMFGIIGQFIPPIAVFMALGLASALLTGLGFRWAPALGGVVAGLLLAMFGGPILETLKTPSGGALMFGLMAATLVAVVLGVISGIGATVQYYRRSVESRLMPRTLRIALPVTLGILAGAIAVAAVPIEGMMADVDAATLAALPTLETKNFEFAQKELRVKAGETVTLRLANADAEAHFLDIDEFGVNALMPAGKESIAVFKPTKPGTYTFYCHPHADKATKEGMVGTLIVE